MKNDVYKNKFMHTNISKVVEDSDTINQAYLINIYNRPTTMQYIIVSSTLATLTNNHFVTKKVLINVKILK